MLSAAGPGSDARCRPYSEWLRKRITVVDTKNGNNPPPVTTKLEHALKTAIYNAEKFSAELGYVVRFDADAIKSMAITVLINMSEGNRR